MVLENSTMLKNKSPEGEFETIHWQMEIARTIFEYHDRSPTVDEYKMIFNGFIPASVKMP